MPVASGQHATTEQMLTRRGASSKQARLDTLFDEYQEFTVELEDGVMAEYEQQEDALVRVEKYTRQLQRATAIEHERRIEMLRAVEVNLSNQFATVREHTFRDLETLRPIVPERLKPWHVRLDDAEVMLAEEREARRIVIERERKKLLKTLDDFERQLENEKVERLEREAVVYQHANEEVSKVQETFESERGRRESMLAHVRTENDQIDAMRDRPDAIFKEGMVARMVKATTDIRAETAKRVYAEQTFVASLESYTKSLQDGLRMVNKQWPTKGGAGRTAVEY